MKHLRIPAALAAATLSALSINALAQTTGTAAPPPPPAENCCMQQRMTPEQRNAAWDKRAAAQAQQLGITAEQRPQWDAYIQARKAMMPTPPAGKDATIAQAMREKMQSMTPEQRLSEQADRMEEMSKKMRTLAAATQKLRASLNSQQQADFDKMQGKPGMRGKHGRHGMKAWPAPDGCHGEGFPPRQQRAPKKERAQKTQ